MTQRGGRPRGGWLRPRPGGRWRPVALAVVAGALVTTAVVITAMAAGCAGGEPDQPRLLRIATGSRNGVYFKYGSALADIINRELPGVRASVLVTNASEENVQKVREGQAEVAFTQADILQEDDRSLVALARVYDDQLHLVVSASGPIRQLSDLRGRRVATGGSGSGTLVTATRLLTVAQLGGPGVLRTMSLGLDESAAALHAGTIDAFFFSGGLPVGAIQSLRRQMDLRLIDLSGYVPAMRRTYTDVYDVRGVPTSTYRLSQPIDTIGDPNYLVVLRRMPDQLAYDLTRLLIERREELGRTHPAAEWLNSRTAINTPPLELHPGAMRYFRNSKE